MAKKVWSTPLLVELVRGAPEEAVLITCKAGLTGSGLGDPASPASTYGTCTTTPFSQLALRCDFCSTIGAS